MSIDYTAMGFSELDALVSDLWVRKEIEPSPPTAQIILLHPNSMIPLPSKTNKPKPKNLSKQNSAYIKKQALANNVISLKIR
jgi:hypothetical protein